MKNKVVIGSLLVLMLSFAIWLVTAVELLVMKSPMLSAVMDICGQFMLWSLITVNVTLEWRNIKRYFLKVYRQLEKVSYHRRYRKLINYKFGEDDVL